MSSIRAASLAAVCAGVLALVRALAAQSAAPEYHIKAAFLMNFTKFVEWPAAAFEGPDSPLTICILGDDPFGGALDELVQGETAGGRKLAVERLRGSPKPKSCQVLFIGKRDQEIAQFLSGVGPGVLTVGERDQALRDGCIIAFILEGRNVRFDVNQAAAAKQSLTISARLLSVARSVRR